VEIPFIKLDDIDAVKEDLAKGGCKPGVCGPRVRTITYLSGKSDLSKRHIDTYDIAKNWMRDISPENFHISLNLV